MRISFCVGTEISVQGVDRGDKRKAQGNTERAMRMARDNDIGGSDKGRSCSYVFVGTSETFSVARDEDIEGEERRVFGERISRTGEEILGNAYLGERVLCKYSRNKRRNNQGIYKKAAGRRRKGRPAAIVERQQRMTLSGVVVS